jgi:probable H4MPT-linked C1 transfer pathway protein
MPEPTRVLGWDVGGAHLKACVLENGQVVDVAQWACPLWQGLQHLEAALAGARERWPLALQATHAVTMTGEMTDLFSSRADGVQRITNLLQAALPGPEQVYAGPAADGRLAEWATPQDAGARWAQIASANWLATAQHAAAVVSDGVLIDIGSTTTDLIALQHGRVHSNSHSDRDRLASGELVYQGAVRTPLCALAQRVSLQGQALNVMNEFFASTADVYRLTGELAAEHDLYPAADNAAKSPEATRRRLARMVGCEPNDASDADWDALAREWRSAQVGLIAESLQRVLAGARTPPDITVVSAGCGDFLVPDISASLPGPAARVLRYGHDVARVAPGPQAEQIKTWAQVCAPSVAVAALLDGATR